VSSKMTLTMEFDRDVPDERDDLLLVVHARALAAVLHNLDEHLRSRAKYAQLPEATVEELHAVRDHIRSELGDLQGLVFR
jgi:hypothetical protein